VLGRRWYLGGYADINDAAKARRSFIEECYGEAFEEMELRSKKAEKEDF